MVAGVFWDIENMFFRYRALVNKHIRNNGYKISTYHRYIGTSKANSYRFTSIKKKHGYCHIIGDDVKSGADKALFNTVLKALPSIDVIIIVSNDKIFHKLRSLTSKKIIVFHDNKSLTSCRSNMDLIYVYNNFKDTK